jgi:hypothetical protein
MDIRPLSAQALYSRVRHTAGAHKIREDKIRRGLCRQQMFQISRSCGCSKQSGILQR